MTTALIPEVIQPGVLYAPSANNLFTIDVGDLPNTDDALIMGGSGGRYKAYQPAILGIHYGWGSGPAAITFWLKPGSVSGTQSGFTSATTLFGVHNQNYANVGSYNSVSITGQDANFAWGVVANTSNVYDRLVALSEWRRTNTASAPGFINQASASTIGAWTFMVFNRPASTGRWALYRDAALSATGATPTAMGVVNWNANLFFSLGAFTFASGPNNPPVDTTIAKLSIHPAEITALEQIDLLDSMLNGPPSP